ncbi:MAG: hypothetical protein ABSE45_05335 [Candidatus Acidiferrales bacterium]
MRSIILGCRSILVGAVVAGLVTFPAMAASEQPLATVVSAQSAYLAKANAVPGADVYLDDDLVTDPGGSLRLKVGQGQVYLLSSSEATLRQQENKVRAKMYRGTLGFSTTAPDQLEIETPMGVVRGADGQRVYGQISLLSPQKIVVSSYQGTLLVVDKAGESQTIAQGQSFTGTLTADSGGGKSDVGVQGVGGSGTNWGHVAWVAGMAIGLAVVGIVLYQEESESCVQQGTC